MSGDPLLVGTYEGDEVNSGVSMKTGTAKPYVIHNAVLKCGLTMYRVGQPTPRGISEASQVARLKHKVGSVWVVHLTGLKRDFGGQVSGTMEPLEQ